MKFCIITHVQHIEFKDQFYGYAPYTREMNIWLKYVDEVTVVAPQIEQSLDPIFETYDHKHLNFIRVPNFNSVSIKEMLFTIVKVPYLMYVIGKAMHAADHIHLRCPGNMGLLGSMVKCSILKKQKQLNMRVIGILKVNNLGVIVSKNGF